MCVCINVLIHTHIVCDKKSTIVCENGIFFLPPGDCVILVEYWPNEVQLH